MKKYLTLFCGMASMLLMTSCWDEDTRVSYNLAGSWEGYFGMYYSYEDNYGWHEVQSDYSEVEFVPAYDYAHHGHGYQVDYYNPRKGPYDYEYYYFTWEVDDFSTIHLTYPGNRDLDVELYDYKISSTLLSGHFKSGERFELSKYKNYYYDWHDDYIGYANSEYGWYYRHGYTRAAGDSITNVRVGRHI